MASEVHTEDPCPELPATFADPEKMREMAEKSRGLDRIPGLVQGR